MEQGYVRGDRHPGPRHAEPSRRGGPAGLVPRGTGTPTGSPSTASPGSPPSSSTPATSTVEAPPPASTPSRGPAHRRLRGSHHGRLGGPAPRPRLRPHRHRRTRPRPGRRRSPAASPTPTRSSRTTPRCSPSSTSTGPPRRAAGTSPSTSSTPPWPSTGPSVAGRPSCPTPMPPIPHSAARGPMRRGGASSNRRSWNQSRRRGRAGCCSRAPPTSAVPPTPTPPQTPPPRMGWSSARQGVRALVGMGIDPPMGDQLAVPGAGDGAPRQATDPPHGGGSRPGPRPWPENTVDTSSTNGPPWAARSTSSATPPGCCGTCPLKCRGRGLPTTCGTTARARTATRSRTRTDAGREAARVAAGQIDEIRGDRRGVVAGVGAGGVAAPGARFRHRSGRFAPRRAQPAEWAEGLVEPPRARHRGGLNQRRRGTRGPALRPGGSGAGEAGRGAQLGGRRRAEAQRPAVHHVVDGLVHPQQARGVPPVRTHSSDPPDFDARRYTGRGEAGHVTRHT